jgi:hypothetical protein
MSGVLNRYPTIKFVSVESGIGWIPFMLEAMDYQFQGNSVREEHPKFALLRRNISRITCTLAIGSNRSRHVA